MFYRKTTIDRRGQIKTVETVKEDASGRAVSSTKDYDSGLDGVIDTREHRTFSYDSSGKLSFETLGVDQSANGSIDYSEETGYAYVSGRLSSKTATSPDGDGDGLPDYTKSETFKYNSSGKETEHKTEWLWNGDTQFAEYRLETKTYTPSGQLDRLIIDDPQIYDFIVGTDRDYDSKGRIKAVKKMDEFKYGDSAWHTEETWAYDDAKGTVIYKGNGQHIKSKFTYPSSNHTQELKEWIGADGKIYKRDLFETWKNKDGLVTTTLNSHDWNLDGKYTSADAKGKNGFRDKETWVYSDGELVSHTLDLGIDKVLDYSMTVEDILV